MKTVEELMKENASLKAEIIQLNKQNNKLTEENTTLKNNVDYLKELLKIRAKEQFARKSEKLSEEGYISLFDDIELSAAEEELERKVEETKVEGYTRKAKSKNLVNQDSNLPVKVVHHTLDNEGLKDINDDYVVRKLCKIPSQLYIQENHYHKYKKVSEEGDSTIVMAPMKETHFGKAMVDTSLIASIIIDKIVQSVPLYRQEKMLSYSGVNLTRQDMSRYAMKSYEILKPISKVIKDYIDKAEIKHSDETPMTVISIKSEVKDKILVGKGPAKSYVWGISTGRGYHPAHYYELGPNRSKDVAERLLCSNSCYVMTDCYNAYFGLKGVTNVFCLAHVNRHFKKIIKKNSPKNSVAVRVVGMIAKIYNEENTIQSLYNGDYNTIKEQRNIILKPLFDELYEYIESVYNGTMTKSVLGDALSYALNAKKGVYNFFLDGRLELDNNNCERETIRPFTIGRKNWLFSDTKNGADATCCLYTIIRSAISNNLDPFKYLLYLFDNIPISPFEEFDYSKLLPWNKDVIEFAGIKKTTFNS